MGSRVIPLYWLHVRRVDTVVKSSRYIHSDLNLKTTRYSTVGDSDAGWTAASIRGYGEPR